MELAAAVGPPSPGWAPTDEDETVWNEIIGVLTSLTNGAQP